MSHVHSTISKRSFKHLTPTQRGQIQALLEQKVAKTQIAQQLGIARSTLYYEIKRGTAEQVNSYGKTYYRYFADTGQLVYEQRRKHSRHPFKAALVQPFLQYVTEQIKSITCPRMQLEEERSETSCFLTSSRLKRCTTISICN